MREFEPKETEFEITECICSWLDLLGFGQPLIDSEWNLHDKRCHAQLERIKKLDLSFINDYSSAYGTTSLSLNDGIISNYDIGNRQPKGIIVNVIDDLVFEYEKLNGRDVSSGNPGVRGILTFGHRYSYTHVNYTYSALYDKDIGYHPLEFQMNTAFSKAYIMESSGSKGGLKGNHLYIDEALLSFIESFLLSNTNTASQYRIDKQLEVSKDLMHFSIYRNENLLLRLEFDINSIKYNYKGINTTLFKYQRRESRQDQLAHESEYRRSQRIQEMEDREHNESNE